MCCAGGRLTSRWDAKQVTVDYLRPDGHVPGRSQPICGVRTLKSTAPPAQDSADSPARPAYTNETWSSSCVGSREVMSRHRQGATCCDVAAALSPRTETCYAHRADHSTL